MIIEKDKAILQLKQEQQNVVEELNNKHNAEIQKYQEKYKELLNELEMSTKSTTHKKNIKSKNSKNTQQSMLQ